MAHWKIKDYGITGKTYECSHCGAIYTYPLHRLVEVAKRCPKCYEYIDKDQEEYEKIPKEVIDVIKYVDAINLKHGAPEELTNPGVNPNIT